MGNFKVGDVCEVIDSFPQWRHQVGMTGAIVEILEHSEGPLYRLDFDAPRSGWGRKCLRLKRPPSKDEFTAGEWELCPWSPYRVGETSNG